MDDETFESFTSEEMAEWRINLALCACDGLTNQQLKACGEGGVRRLVEAAQAVAVTAETITTLAEGMAYTQGEKWEHSAIDGVIAECHAALAPFTTGTDDDDDPH